MEKVFSVEAMAWENLRGLPGGDGNEAAAATLVSATR
jgi:hypothetical protein